MATKKLQKRLLKRSKKAENISAPLYAVTGKSAGNC
jgi:hypothetical protein